MRRLFAITLVGFVICAATAASAGVSYNGTRGLVRTRSADTVGKGVLNFQLSSHYYMLGDSTLSGTRFPFNDGLTSDAFVAYHFFITRATLTYGLNDYFELSANLDVRNWVRDTKNAGGHELPGLSRGQLGDTQISGKLRFPIPVSNLRLGLYGSANAPTGNKERRFTTDTWDFVALGLLTLDFTDLDAFVPTRIHINSGWSFNRNEDRGYGLFLAEYPDETGFMPPAYPRTPPGESNSFNDEVLFNAAIEFPAPQLTIFIEFDWRSLSGLDDAYSDVFVVDSTVTGRGNVAYPLSLDGKNKNTLTLTPGASFNLPYGFEIKGALDVNLNGGDKPPLSGAPDLGWWLVLGKSGSVVPQDKDGDGIPDKDDACPDQAEDLDGFQDSDGCPELDNDGDGIVDDQDQCPDLAEDLDGYEDQDGCPDLDNDQDGVPDVDDRCPNEPEDFDGDQDEDGCPDLVKDSDNDGIPDEQDRCPLQAEDVDGFQDDDGCPDLDNDLDGITDANDKCPNSPETFNGFQDEDGCPDDRPLEQQFILKGVTFESGSAALTPDSYRVLDEVVRSLMAFPEVRIEIQGYTDSVGKAGANLDLSQRRAEAVKQYLVNAGIDPARLNAVGYGEENPIASNSTPAGRAQNRRIEFKRLN